ncbi:unnamed protein product [Caenorhabditis sp. 36 PRJEB53466]|nr:unnamed protein product [Caenorhabditis sp. 36 PRJEB53466]
MHWSQKFEVDEKLAGFEAITIEDNPSVIDAKENRAKTARKRTRNEGKIRTNKKEKQQVGDGNKNEQGEKDRFEDREEKEENETEHNDFHHPTYSMKSLAIIPDLLDEPCDDYDLDDLELDPIRNVVEEEMYSDFFKQQLNHLPIDKMLKVQSLNDHIFQDTLNSCRGLIYPDMIPQNVKDFFISNIAYKRNDKQISFRKLREFYHAKELAAVVVPAHLVEFYYKEKNNLGGNWRQERVELELSIEPEMLTKLNGCGISFICDIAHFSSPHTNKMTSMTKKRSGIVSQKDKERIEQLIVHANQPIAPNEDNDSGYSSPNSKTNYNDEQS